MLALTLSPPNRVVRFDVTWVGVVPAAEPRRDTLPEPTTVLLGGVRASTPGRGDACGRPCMEAWRARQSPRAA